ncbi:type IV pilus twitching motility protein PilT [Candidatus Omnitrophota bacterium]
MKEDIKKFLVEMTKNRASDLHVNAAAPIEYRIDGDLVNATEKIFSPDEAKETVYDLLNEEQIKRFEREKELDFSFQIKDVARFRGNVFLQRGCVGCAIRIIPFEIMSLDECGLPVKLVRKFCKAQKGMVLVTGATGSGKSTTLAAMVEEINSNRKCHIVTVEDPIEFVHNNKQSLIDQRQLSEDTYSFGNALRHVLRQDPDVILIGEMRDLDTIQQAMIIADTGHLVLATLHTSDSVQTINRIIDVFPSHQQPQIRSQLSFVLLGIISQQLLVRSDAPGMILASEVLVATHAVRSMIREAKEHQIASIIQTSQKMGMRTMNQALSELYASGKITYDEALSKSTDAEGLVKLIGEER